MNAHSNITTGPTKAKSAVKIGSPMLPGSKADQFESDYQKKAAPRRAAMRATIDAASSASYSLVEAAKAHLVAYTDRDTLAEPASGSPEYPAWEAECQRLDKIEGEAWLEFLSHPCFGAPDQNFKAAYVEARPGGMNNLLDEAAEALITSMRTVGGRDFSGVTVGSMVYVRPASGGRAEGLCIVKEDLGDTLTDCTISGDVETFRRDMISHWLEGVVVEGGHRGRVISNPPDDSQMLGFASRFDAMRPVQEAAWKGLAEQRKAAEKVFEAKHGAEPDDLAAARAWRDRFQASPGYRRWHLDEEHYSQTLGTPTYMLAAAIEMMKPNTLAGFAAKARVRVYMNEMAGGGGEDDYEHRQLVEIAEEASALTGSAGEPPASDDPIVPFLDLSEFSVTKLIWLASSTRKFAGACNEFAEGELFKNRITEGEYKGAFDYSENGELVAKFTDWADHQRDRIIAEIAARQPSTADEAYRRCLALIKYSEENDQELTDAMAILVEGIEHERALSAKAA